MSGSLLGRVKQASGVCGTLNHRQTREGKTLQGMSNAQPAPSWDGDGLLTTAGRPAQYHSTSMDNHRRVQLCSRCTSNPAPHPNGDAFSATKGSARRRVLTAASFPGTDRFNVVGRLSWIQERDVCLRSNGIHGPLLAIGQTHILPAVG